MKPLPGEYIYSDAPNPHFERMRGILKAHPEVRDLFGPAPVTALWAFGIVALQVAVGAFVSGLHPGWIVLIAYLVGAVANHALFVIIHECTHNLVFKNPTANRLLGIFVNFPQFFPSAMPFAKYHMLHHTNQSEYDYDADIAGPREARWIGASPLRKILFLSFFGFIQGLVRPARLKKVPFLDRWIVLNFFVQLSFLVAFYFIGGWKPLLYFFLSTFFGLGLHPLGARWIQEHYVVKEGQETYSYYGPLNRLCFNMGYHNEHHDFMKVPWSRLPKLRTLAPEFYDPLYTHKSWTALLFRFVFDKNLTLYSRIVRDGKAPATDEKAALNSPFKAEAPLTA